MAGYIGSAGVSAPARVSEIRDTFTATQGQTVFNTSAPFTPDTCSVFLNGSKLVNGADYDSTSGNAIVLAAGVTAGDIVEFIGRAGFTVADAYSKAEVDAGQVVLNAIKKVDGAGSGLDADSLRGLPADFTSSNTTNGYQKLPSGLIIQWGRVTSPDDTSVNVVFPIAFPNQIFAVSFGGIFNSVENPGGWRLRQPSVTGFISDRENAVYDNSFDHLYLAIGY